MTTTPQDIQAALDEMPKRPDIRNDQECDLFFSWSLRHYDEIRHCLQSAAPVQDAGGLDIEACRKFFDDWFGPAFGPPEHLERIAARHAKSREEFANKLMAFVASRLALDGPPITPNKLADWMSANGFATGHGDSTDDLLAELTWQVQELRDRVKK